jgi:hypothetical protein
MRRQKRKAGAGIGGDQKARGDDAEKRKAGEGSGKDRKNSRLLGTKKKNWSREWRRQESYRR